MILITGSTNVPLGRAIADNLEISQAEREIAVFSDGEIRIRLETPVINQNVILVQSLVGRVNEALVETCLIADALKTQGAKSITALIPYLAYARQNKAHRPGEAVSAATIAKLLQISGCDRLITCDIHAQNALTYFQIPTVNTSIFPILLTTLLSDIGKDRKSSLVVVSPDQDGDKRAKIAAQALGVPHAYIEKERDLNAIDKLKEIHGQKVVGDVAHKIAVLADDMIATGDTILQAVRYVKEAGASQIYVVATHGLFTRGYAFVSDSVDLSGIYISDSILQSNLPAKIKVVSIATHLADLINH